MNINEAIYLVLLVSVMIVDIWKLSEITDRHKVFESLADFKIKEIEDKVMKLEKILKSSRDPDIDEEEEDWEDEIYND